MEKPVAKLIQFLKKSIAGLGLTQTEVERRLGLSQGYLSRLFGGQIDLKVDHVVQIARVLHVDPEQIFLLAFREALSDPAKEKEKTRRMQETFGLLAQDPSPEELAEIEKDIERIVQRVLDKRDREAGD